MKTSLYTKQRFIQLSREKLMKFKDSTIKCILQGYLKDGEFMEWTLPPMQTLRISQVFLYTFCMNYIFLCEVCFSDQRRSVNESVYNIERTQVFCFDLGTLMLFQFFIGPEEAPLQQLFCACHFLLGHPQRGRRGQSSRGSLHSKKCATGLSCMWRAIWYYIIFLYC